MHERSRPFEIYVEAEQVTAWNYKTTLGNLNIGIFLWRLPEINIHVNFSDVQCGKELHPFHERV